MTQKLINEYNTQQAGMPKPNKNVKIHAHDSEFIVRGDDHEASLNKFRRFNTYVCCRCMLGVAVLP